MSRKKNFLRGVASGYLALGANIVYTMCSIPVALHYLPKDEFGLWALVSQLAGYLMLIDLGMIGSVSRILVDSKDDRDGGQYGSILLTSGLVFAVQAAIVGIGGCLLSPLITHMVQVPKQHEAIFNILFCFQCVLLGLGFLSRFFGAPLYAHQRYDVSNFSQASQLLIALGVLWAGFALGLGLYSMVLSGAASWLWSTIYQGLAGFRAGLFPRKGCWGRPQMAIFKELFSFGKDVFLMTLGWQLTSASQVIIVSRFLGLDAAATWSVCTKIATMAQQFVWRIFDFSSGAFSEMFVRGETERLRKRFREILVVTASLGVACWAFIAYCNGPFVRVWSHGRISWEPLNDVLLGALVLIYSITRCHGGMTGVAKKIGFARYVYFAEGLFFVLSSIVVSKVWGFSGILLCAIVADLLFPFAYGHYRSKGFFQADYRQLAIEWVKPSLLYALLFLAPVLVACWLSGSEAGKLALALRFSVLAVAGLPLFWWIGLTGEIREELREKLRPVLGRIFSGKKGKGEESAG